MTNNLNSHWQFQSIDGDNAVVDDNGFVLEAPDEQTGRELVRRWNYFLEMEQKGLIPEKLKMAAQYLESIAKWAGNLPDDALISETGAKDAAYRGQMVAHMRGLAAEALSFIKAE